MEIKAPYLQAIQAIAGKTPGEKQKTINSIARQIAQAERLSGKSVNSETQIPAVPEPLKPLVRVEVAKILHQYEVVIEAFKSEDMNVVNRALQAKWFFDGSSTRVINSQYFFDNVFPEISLYARLRIVKNFGTYLKNTAVAAEFFLTLTEKYGVGQAVPLLVACEEDFAFKMIIRNRIVLSLNMVESLYQKYPNLVIKYLMLTKPGDNETRNIYRINIHDYENFLPEIANNHLEDFMKIYSMHDDLDVKLGRRATKIFLKSQLDLLLEKPDQYLKLISLKTVTQKLSVADFSKIFKNLFPAEKNYFCYNTVNSYLKYYEPKENKVPLILDTFREVYGQDLLSCKQLVDFFLIIVLPAEDRVNQARLKLNDDKDWHIECVQKSWRCYLPTCESIPAITKKISESSDVSIRMKLLKQLIFTCEANDDKNALLKVLNYIYDRHRNERKWVLYECLTDISNWFDLLTFSSEHWEILNKYVKLAEIKNDLFNEMDTMEKVIGAALQYCFFNNLPMDEYMRMFVDMKVQMYCGTWNIVTKNPELEKKFLDMCIEIIPKQYPADNKIWKKQEADIISSLASSLWDFNERHKVLLSGKLKKLWIKDYPWLFQTIKSHILGETSENDWSKRSFLDDIKKNDRALYYELIYDLEKFWYFQLGVTFDILKKQPHRILNHLTECLEKIETVYCSHEHLSSFVTKSLWYQQLPIELFKESLRTCSDSETCLRSISTLALLSDRETFAKIIEPFIPSDEKLDVDHPDAKKTYSIQLAISKNLRKVNPLISLDVIANFCVGDYLQIAIGSLTSVCRRKPVSKVIPFAKTLTNRRVSVMKHGIRLSYLVAPLEETYTYLTDLWNSEDHTSVRLVVFTKIYDLFCKQPDSRSWSMIRTCLDNLNTEDDKEIFKKLTRLSTVPNEYLYEYIKSVLNAIKALEQKSDDPEQYSTISRQLIENIDGPVTQILPEKYCQDLIKEYLFVFEYDSKIFTVGLNLTVGSYLLSSKKYDESRFKFFGDFFRHVVKEYWNKSHPKSLKFYPMNYMTGKFFARVTSITTDKYDVRIFESLLEIFQSVLQPHQDALSYLNLVYSIAYHKSQNSVDFGKRIAEKIPELIEIFSPECVISISNRLSSFISCRSRKFCESEINEEKLLTIIEAFIKSESIYCTFCAANMLFYNNWKKLNERHNTVVDALRNSRNPGVLWFVNSRLSSFDFCTEEDE